MVGEEVPGSHLVEAQGINLGLSRRHSVLEVDIIFFSLAISGCSFFLNFHFIQHSYTP